MEAYFQIVKEYILDMGYTITHEDEEDGVFVLDNESNGIKNLVVGCADPLLIVEQFIFDIKETSAETYKNLLQKNRDIIHGAFVLDETGNKVIFRNTHELENLDLNELEATFNSLAFLLGEYSEELIKFSEN